MTRNAVGLFVAIAGIWLSGAGVVGERRLQGADALLRSGFDHVNSWSRRIGEYAISLIGKGYGLTSHLISATKSNFDIRTAYLPFLLLLLIYLFTIITAFEALFFVAEISFVAVAINFAVVWLASLNSYSPSTFGQSVVTIIGSFIYMTGKIIIRKAKKQSEMVMDDSPAEKPTHIFWMVLSPRHVVYGFVVFVILTLCIVPLVMFLLLGIVISFVMGILWISTVPYRALDQLVSHAKLQSTIVVIGMLLSSLGVYLLL